MCSVDITVEQPLHPWVPLPFQMASDVLSVAWPCRSMIRPKACAWLTAATVRDPPSRLRAANPYWAEGFPRFAPKKEKKGKCQPPEIFFFTPRCSLYRFKLFDRSLSAYVSTILQTVIFLTLCRWIYVDSMWFTCVWQHIKHLHT